MYNYFKAIFVIMEVTMQENAGKWVHQYINKQREILISHMPTTLIPRVYVSFQRHSKHILPHRLVNCCVCYAHQAREIYQVLSHPWMSQFPGNFEIHRVRQYLVSVVLVGIKEMKTSKMTIRLKSYFYNGPVHLFPIILHYMWYFETTLD